MIRGRSRRRRWQDLSQRQRRAIGLAGLAQFALLAMALTDWLRRPARDVRGPKLAWLPLLFVNFAGPIAYMVLGRRRAEPEVEWGPEA
jgi:hypothetical protein